MQSEPTDVAYAADVDLTKTSDTVLFHHNVSHWATRLLSNCE